MTLILTWIESLHQTRGGTVAGHDQAAAAVMGQVRNLLRGIAYTSQDSPAAVLAALDEAMDGLGVTCLTSVVAIRLEQPAEGGARRVRWCNAGHPAPVHLPAAGGVRALESRPEMVLGADVTTARSDHELVLAAGDGLMLNTDGLIERRGSNRLFAVPGEGRGVSRQAWSCPGDVEGPWSCWDGCC